MFQHAGPSKLLGKPKIGRKPPSQTILGSLLPWHTATGITQWALFPAVCHACNHVQISCMASAVVPACGLLPHVKLCFGTLGLFGIQFGM